MPFSGHLLETGEPIWDAQKDHPFVRELADGSLDEAAFLHWVRQDYATPANARRWRRRS